MSDAKITFETRFDSSQFEDSIRGIDKSLNDVRSTVTKVSSASLDAFGKSTRNEIERTTIRLANKTQALQKNLDKVNELSTKYAKLLSGDMEPKELISMNNELDKTNLKIVQQIKSMRGVRAEIAQLEADMKRISGYMEREGLPDENKEILQVEFNEAKENVATFNRMLESSDSVLERLKNRAAELREEIAKVKLNPENSSEAKKVKLELMETERVIQILNAEALFTEGALGRTFDSNEINAFGGAVNKTSNYFGFMRNHVDKLKMGIRESYIGMSLFKRKTKESSSPLGKVANRIRRIAVATIFYQVFRSIFRDTREYLSLLLKSNEQITSSIATLKFNLQVAFQPLWQTVLPTLQKITDMLMVASAYLAKFTNMFFGKSLEGSQQAVKNLKAQEDGYNKTGKAAKKAGKQVQGFDILNKMQDDSDDAPIIKDIYVDETPLMRKIIESVDKFTDVFRKAWGKEGKNTIDSMKSSLRSVIKLIESMGSSFMDVWTNGSGQRYLETILRIVQAINRVVENLAKSFKEAWETNEIGTKIIQGIFDGFNNVLEYVEKLINKIADWVLGVDFYPLLNSLEIYIKSVGKLADSVGRGVLWLWDNVLAPLASWFIEKLLPALIEFRAAIFEFISALLDALGPLIASIFDAFLKPLASILGDLLIGLIKSLTEALNKLSDWTRENEEAVRLMAVAVGMLLGYFALYTLKQNIIPKVGQLITTLMKFGSTVATMLQSVTPAGLAIGIMAGAIVYLGSNWNKLNGAERAATILGGLASAAIVASVAIAAFHASWSVGLAAAAIAGGLTAVGIGYSRLKKQTGVSADQPNIMGQASRMSVPNATPREGIAFANVVKGSPPLPRLAKGGLIPPRKPRQVIVGDNMVEDEIVSPVSTMKKAFAEVLVESGSYNRLNDNVLLEILNAIKEGSIMVVNDRELGRVIAESNRDIDTRTGIRIR